VKAHDVSREGEQRSAKDNDAGESGREGVIGTQDDEPIARNRRRLPLDGASPCDYSRQKSLGQKPVGRKDRESYGIEKTTSIAKEVLNEWADGSIAL